MGRGYLYDPAKTAEVFVPDPFSTKPGARIYKMGDLAQYLPDGNLEFLGRIDTQVKVRGHRVELGEIETVLKQHPAVHQCAVLLNEGNLFVYVVPERDTLGMSEKQQIDTYLTQWHTVFDEIYAQQTTLHNNMAMHSRVWRSSYTNQDISIEEIIECIEDSVARIMALKPANVLEIGCGTGLILSHIAPFCRLYYATDFSQEALRFAEVQIQQSEKIILRCISCVKQQTLLTIYPSIHSIWLFSMR